MKSSKQLPAISFVMDKAAGSGDHLDPKWDLMYLIEKMDNSGNGVIYPDLEMETPYVVIPLERDTLTATGG